MIGTQIFRRFFPRPTYSFPVSQLIPFNLIVSSVNYDYSFIIIFIIVYIIEILLRIIGVGPLEHFKKKRNMYASYILLKIFYLWWSFFSPLRTRMTLCRLDFLVILVSFICLLLENEAKFVFLASIRPFKLIRLIKLSVHYYSLVPMALSLDPPQRAWGRG